jgi:hypothetical protein
MVARFDTTAAGRLRLIIPTVFEVSVLQGNGNGNGNRNHKNKRKRNSENGPGDDNCEWCNGFHPSDNCWQKYPKKKPEYAKEEERTE